jgi:hypothetical protein
MPSGIALPTGREIWLPDGTVVDPLFGGRLTDDGAVIVVPYVFCGQVLALHPLSWILFDRPELSELVGNCIASPRFDVALQSGRVEDFPEYWGMVQAILTAAYLYQVAREGNESRRKQRPLGGIDASVANPPSAPGPLTADAVLRDYVSAAEDRCPCGGNYQYEKTDLPAADGETVIIPVTCCNCGVPAELSRTLDEMETTFKLRHKSIRNRVPQ